MLSVSAPASGNVIINFGAFPGMVGASVDITGQDEILSTSKIVAVIRVADTADHSADEHRVERVTITAGNIIPGTGFTIYARARSGRLSGQWGVSWTWS